MHETRYPAAAGMFYENGSKELAEHVEKLFSGLSEGDCRIVVSPHAGYVYSGRTAAHAISSLRPAKKFIILGPNHTGLGMEFSVMSSGKWMMPIGSFKIDSSIAKRLDALDFVYDDMRAHEREHSIEVQLPFIHHRFRDFTFVPLCIMNTTYSGGFLQQCRELGRKISTIMKNDSDVALIASSDFSHYLPQKIADEKDGAAIDKIEAMNIRGFFRTLEEQDASVCGFGPIATAMEAADLLGLKPKVLHKSSSGDATGDYSQVVSYYAIGFS